MIHMLVMDVDGTLTDGKIYLSENGDELKAFHVKDGQGIRMLREAGVRTAIITGRSSSIVERRAKELKIDFVFQGIENKAACLQQLAKEEKMALEEIAYIGDDINDEQAMELCGQVYAPADACAKIQERADVVLHIAGGQGAVRECAEWILAQNGQSV